MDIIIKKKLIKLIKHPILYFKDLKILAFYKEYKKSLENKEDEEDLLYLFEKIVKQIANTYPVSSLKIIQTNVSIWPYIKFNLFLYCNTLARNPNTKFFCYSPFLDKISREGFIETYKGNYLSDIKEGRADTLFFHNYKGIAYVEIDGNYYDRILDPIQSYFSEKSSVRSFTLVNHYSIPHELINPSEYFIFFPNLKTLNYEFILNVDSFINKNIALLRKLKIKAGDIYKICNIFMLLKEEFAKILEKTKPKRIVLFPFWYYLPLVYVAKTQGIEVIDVQHGNMLGGTLMYGDWLELTENMELFLPDKMLVWTVADQINVTKWYKGKVKAIVIGYKWLDIYSYYYKDNVINQSFLSFTKKYKNIVCFSATKGKCIPNIFIDIISDSRATLYDVGFIIKEKKGLSTIDKDLLKKYRNLYGSYEINSLPIIKVLEYCKLHITEVSSAIYEADYLGLWSCIIGDSYIHHFRNLVDDNKLIKLNTQDDFYDKLNLLITTCPAKRFISNDFHKLDM